MRTEEAVMWAGSRRRLAELLGIWPHAIYRWGVFPPPQRQWQLQVLSGGRLKVEKELRESGVLSVVGYAGDAK